MWRARISSLRFICIVKNSVLWQKKAYSKETWNCEIVVEWKNYLQVCEILNEFSISTHQRLDKESNSRIFNKYKTQTFSGFHSTLFGWSIAIDLMVHGLLFGWSIVIDLMVHSSLFEGFIAIDLIVHSHFLSGLLW